MVQKRPYPTNGVLKINTNEMDNSKFPQLTVSPRMYDGDYLNEILISRSGDSVKRILSSKIETNQEYQLQPYTDNSNSDSQMVRTLIFNHSTGKFFGTLGLTGTEWGYGRLVLLEPIVNYG
jgi:hypothetical protein